MNLEICWRREEMDECTFYDMFGECNYYGDKCENHPTCSGIEEADQIEEMIKKTNGGYY